MRSKEHTAKTKCMINNSSSSYDQAKARKYHKKFSVINKMVTIIDTITAAAAAAVESSNSNNSTLNK